MLKLLMVSQCLKISRAINNMINIPFYRSEDREKMTLGACVVLLFVFASAEAQYKSCRVPAICVKNVGGRDKQVTVWKEMDCGSSVGDHRI